MPIHTIAMNNWFDFRPPRGGIAWLAGCLALAATFFIVQGGDSWYTRFVVPCFLPIGIGLWLKHSWARWVTFAFFTMVAVFWIILLFVRGFSMRSMLQGIAIASSLFALWEWDVWPEEYAKDDEDYYEDEDDDNESFDDSPMDMLRYHDEA